MLMPQSSVRRSRTLRSKTLDIRRSTLGTPANTLNPRTTWWRLQRHGTPAALQTSCFQGNGMCSSQSHFEPRQRGQSLRARFFMRKADSAQSMKLRVAMPIDAGTRVAVSGSATACGHRRSRARHLAIPLAGAAAKGLSASTQQVRVEPPDPGAIGRATMCCQTQYAGMRQSR